jgi:4-amino-4-deoxy-L-arabinose transferase-like glycosyltransferase
MGRVSRDVKSLAVVFVVALVLRLIPVSLTLDVGIALDDMFQYDALAESIRLGHGYTWYGGIPTAFRAPLYPLFLAVIYACFGHQLLAVRIIQSMVGASVPLVVYVLARRMFDDRVARIASWVMVFYPMCLLYPLGLVTENLFFLLVPLTVFYLIKAVDTSRMFYYLLAGLLLGLSILTRSVMSGFALVILPWLWCYVSNRKEAFKNWGLLLLCVGVLTIPWSIRNSLLHGQFVFVESSLGFNFYLGYHPEGTGTFDSSIAVDLMEGIGGFDEPGLDTERLVHNLGIERGMGFIQKDPARAAWLLVSKLSHLLRLDKRAALYFYSNNFLGELPALILFLVLLVLCLPWVVVVLLSVIGMSFGDIARDKVLIYLLFVYFIGVHMLIMAEPRFHLVLVPFLAMFAVQGARTLPKLKGQLQAKEVCVQRGARWRLIWCLLMMALLVLNWVYELNVDMEKLRLVLSPGGNMARFTY